MQTVTPCSICNVPARRIHSRYRRTLTDLPWSGYSIQLKLSVRRLFCDNTQCERRIFTERLPKVALPWARRTSRVAKRLAMIGLALGGAAGARLSQRLGLTVSRNTLLRLIRRTPFPLVATPRVLGVDDFSFRKRHTYGTVLIDLERRRPVALLNDREAETLAQWLKAHPGVQIIARDRSKAYAEGARQSVPEAVQVADRFHLLQNLVEALEQVFTAHTEYLRVVNEAGIRLSLPTHGATTAIPVPPPLLQTRAQTKATERRARRLARYEQVWALHAQGWPGGSIAKQLGIGKSTVFRYLRTPTFPERQGRSDRGRSLLDPYKSLVIERWNGGCYDARRLFRAIQTHGYRGSYCTVARYVRRLHQAQAPTARRNRRQGRMAVIEPPKRALTPRSAAHLVLRRVEKRDDDDVQRLAQLQAQHAELAEAIALAQEFMDLVRHRQSEQLDSWLAWAAQSQLSAFRRFAKRLWEDYEAVKAGVTLPWSNGPAEGHINRLKMLKRQMFGRAGIDLLSRRFLQAA
jgi:transposase